MNIADADGVVVASGVLEVGKIGFDPIKDSGKTIGTERVHSTKVRP